jgi:signal recognition particle GTPase
MFFLKKIFKKKLNIDEVEDLLYESGVEPKFADIIIQKIETVKSDEEDLKKLIKKELFDQFKIKHLVSFNLKIRA